MEGIVERIGAFALVGLGSGFASGLFGIGGGIVRIPIFVYLLPLFGVPQPVLMHVAVGTSIALSAERGGLDPQAAGAEQSRFGIFPHLGRGNFCRRAYRNRPGAVGFD